MEVKNARGIDEAGTAKLINNLKKKAEELQGSPVLFELIQVSLSSFFYSLINNCYIIIIIVHIFDTIFHCYSLLIMIIIKKMARDLLTENNRPHEDCPICLVPFEESEDFIKTPCFHYFHNECFMSYCQTYAKKQDKKKEKKERKEDKKKRNEERNEEKRKKKKKRKERKGRKEGKERKKTTYKINIFVI